MWGRGNRPTDLAKGAAWRSNNVMTPGGSPVSKWQVVGLVVGGVIVVGVLGVAAFVPGDVVSRIIGVSGFIVAAGKVGYDIWEKAAEKRKKHEAATKPIQFQVQSPRVTYQRHNPGYGNEDTNKEMAGGIGYYLTINMFNDRPDSIGLRDLEVQARSGDTILKRSVPYEYNGQWPIDVVAVTLPAKEWIGVQVHGTLWFGEDGREDLARCDTVWLTASTTTGEVVAEKLTDKILGVDQLRELNGKAG